MALASSIRDFSESPLDLNDEEVSDDPVIFKLKYLGNTLMAPSQADDKSNKKMKLSKKSQLVTTSAIKKVISSSKSQKKIPEVTLAISPKGIETFDSVTDEPLLKIPIYKISFCSIDAAHDTIFAFVSSLSDDETKSFEAKTSGDSSALDDGEGLLLHAFQCQKKKIAHNVTMTVARWVFILSDFDSLLELLFHRAFERAYQIYQNEKFLDEVHSKDTKNKENVESQMNSANIKRLISSDASESADSSFLIDLGSENGPQLNQIYSKELTRDYFQTTWVSFEWVQPSNECYRINLNSIQ